MRSQFMVSLRFLDSDAAEVTDAALAAWLRLTAYCARKLTGGRIVACRGWDAARWGIAARVRRDQVDACVAELLAAWHDDDLLLRAYDVRGEGLYRAQSDAAATTNAKRRAATSERWRVALGEPAAPADPPAGATGNDADRSRSPSTLTDHGGERSALTLSVDAERQRSHSDTVGGDAGQRERSPSTHTDDADRHSGRSPSTHTACSSLASRYRAAAAASRGGEGDTHPDDPAELDRCIASHGGALEDPETHVDLRPAWRAAVEGLDAVQRAEVFVRGPAAVGHALRYPTGFFKARQRLFPLPAAGADAGAPVLPTAADLRRRAEIRESDRANAAAEAACAPGWARLAEHLRALDAAGYEAAIADCGDRLVLRALGELRAGGGILRGHIMLRRIAGSVPAFAAVINAAPAVSP